MNMRLRLVHSTPTKNSPTPSRLSRNSPGALNPSSPLDVLRAKRPDAAAVVDRLIEDFLREEAPVASCVCGTRVPLLPPPDYD